MLIMKILKYYATLCVFALSVICPYAYAMDSWESEVVADMEIEFTDDSHARVESSEPDGTIVFDEPTQTDKLALCVVECDTEEREQELSATESERKPVSEIAFSDSTEDVGAREIAESVQETSETESAREPVSEPAFSDSTEDVGERETVENAQETSETESAREPISEPAFSDSTEDVGERETVENAQETSETESARESVSEPAFSNSTEDAGEHEVSLNESSKDSLNLEQEDSEENQQSQNPFSSIFDFKVDPYGLIESTSAARYGGGRVEPDARIVFRNRNGSDYDFSSHSDHIELWNEGSFPIMVTVEAYVDVLHEEAAISEGLSENSIDLEGEDTSDTDSAVYLFLVDSQGRQTRLINGRLTSIQSVIPEASAQEPAYYSFGITGACAINADWENEDTNFSLKLSWAISSVPSVQEISALDDSMNRANISEQHENSSDSAQITNDGKIIGTKNLNPLTEMETLTDEETFQYPDAVEPVENSGNAEDGNPPTEAETSTDEETLQNPDATELVENSENADDENPPAEAETSTDEETLQNPDVAELVENSENAEDENPPTEAETSTDEETLQNPDVAEPVENPENADGEEESNSKVL